MKKTRYTKKKRNHFCLLVNPEAGNYNYKNIKKLTAAIKNKGDNYSVFEPKTALDLYNAALKICGLRRWGRNIPHQFSQRGDVTAIIACGGDGTFNLAARAALKANIPVGIMPMGKENNIAKSIYKSDSCDNAIGKILEQKHRLIDHGIVGEQIFFGSIGLGYLAELANYLKNNDKPRFSFGWNKLGNKIAKIVKSRKMLIKIDAFRFEISPRILNVQLLSLASGIVFSPNSIPNDKQMEIIFDFGVDSKKIGSFSRDIFKKKYNYNEEIKLFRGEKVSFQPVKNMDLYLDGELIKLPNDFIEIKIGPEQLKVLC